jgi:hypothetical protein
MSLRAGIQHDGKLAVQLVDRANSLSRQRYRPASRHGSLPGRRRRTPGSATSRQPSTHWTGPKVSPAGQTPATAHGRGPIPLVTEDWTAIGVPSPPG